MNKLTIYATGNLTKKKSTNVSYYIIEKNREFLSWLNDLLKEFEINKETTEVLVENGSDDDIIMVKDLKRMVDIHERYDNVDLRVDLFYGVERVFLTLSGDPDIRDRFAKKILDTTEWVRVEKSGKPWLKPLKR